jgi:hypothetical protein
MDRVRKALDLARMERTHSVVKPVPEPAAAADVEEEPPSKATVASILYTRTKVFTPQPGHLERNRIMNPASSDPAAAAYRMTRGS